MQCLYCDTAITSEDEAVRLGESNLRLCVPCNNRIRIMKKAKDTITGNVPAKDRLDNYVKHENGAVFLLTENTREKGKVFLVSSKYKFHSVSLQSIKQGLVDGKWRYVNEHEVRKFDDEYIENVNAIVQKVLKHVIAAELLMSVDADLDAQEIGDRYFRSLLAKSNKHAERIANKHVDNIYEADPEMFNHIIRTLEQQVKLIASLQLEDIPYFAQYTKKFFEDPKAFRTDDVEFNTEV